MNRQIEKRNLEIFIGKIKITTIKLELELNTHIKVIDGGNLMPNEIYSINYDQFSKVVKRKALKLYGKQTPS